MAEEKEVGKRLDFLTQELNREANTVASKTNNMVIKGKCPCDQERDRKDSRAGTER